MSDIESLHFKIGLSGTYWDKVPKYTILVNDTEYGEGYISEQPGNVQFFEFNADIPEGPVVLKIRLENKTNFDTVESEDKTSLLKDMLLNICSVEIDKINLGSLMWTHSKFVADDPNRPELKNCVNLGWNGTWELEFHSPFYIWVLENI